MKKVTWSHSIQAKKWNKQKYTFLRIAPPETHTWALLFWRDRHSKLIHISAFQVPCVCVCVSRHDCDGTHWVSQPYSLYCLWVPCPRSPSTPSRQPTVDKTSLYLGTGLERLEVCQLFVYTLPLWKWLRAVQFLACLAPNSSKGLSLSFGYIWFEYFLLKFLSSPSVYLCLSVSFCPLLSPTSCCARCSCDSVQWSNVSRLL